MKPVGSAPSTSSILTPVGDDDFDIDDTSIDNEPILIDREKYKIISPILTTIRNLVSCHSTKQFLDYVEEFRRIEKLIRNGKVLLNNNPIRPESNDENDENVENNENVENDENNENAENVENVETIIDVGTSNPPSNAEPTSRYKIKFKEGLKSKGRPKKRSKQLTFNKTNIDKKKKLNSKKKMPISDLLDRMLESNDGYMGNETESRNNQIEDLVPMNNEAPGVLSYSSLLHSRDYVSFEVDRSIIPAKLETNNIVANSFTYLMNNLD